MTGSVSILSMICMGVSALISFAIPVVLCLYLRKKKQADIVPFFIGAAVFVVMALVLESVVHNLVLVFSPVGPTILNNTWLYAFYGGTMAGLFEEAGRYIAMRFFLKKYRNKDENALMYGAGHGGAEAAILLGSTMISYIVMSVLFNTGMADVLYKGQPAEAVAQIDALFAELMTTSPATFLAGIVERVFAVTLHIALSVLVWFSVKKPEKWYLVLIAFMLHAGVDAITVILSRLGIPIWLVEVLLGVMTAAVAANSVLLWRWYQPGPDEEEAEPSPAE
ncbi:MAG: YhfC family intramembrane metalloprotease [Clostridia bacterium]|nr:YhfC family intramembrane metalloprotease [Clostridia bacterium]